MPVRMLITEGTAAECKHALFLIDGIATQHLLADRAYDTDAILAYLEKNLIEPVIPSKKNRKEKRQHDQYLYKIRHLVENAFLHLKQWRGIATRYAKNSSSFLAAVNIRCLKLWLEIS